MPEFQPFPKIARLRREMVITEKIDGTNAAIGIDETGQVWAQSRKRLITPEQDNAGFARWVADNQADLIDALGPGLHFGEWWGQGIQRGYGLSQKRFSLFNTKRWGEGGGGLRVGPCHVVPVLGHYDDFDTGHAHGALCLLQQAGSFAAPGYARPEGIVCYHKAGNVMFKQTLEGDQKGRQYE